MNEPIWIIDRVALAAHTRILNEHRGRAYGHDPVRLVAALSMPKNTLALLGARAQLMELAAIQAWAIGRLRPFEEGNAATACLLAMLFLRLNGVELPAPASEKYAVFQGLATGRLALAAVVQWMKTRHVANITGSSSVVRVQVSKGRVTNVTVIGQGAGRRPTRDVVPMSPVLAGAALPVDPLVTSGKVEGSRLPAADPT